MTQKTKQRLIRAVNVFVQFTFVVYSVGFGFLVAPLAANAAEAANPSANLDQCANDPAPSPSSDGCATNANEWVNGNLGASKSVYFEGDSIPYRMLFENLSLGSHDVIIEWDTTQSSTHALDYLTTYNQTVATANPCLGVSGCAASTTFPIPADPQVTGAGVTPIAGNFTFFGGTITGVSAYSYAGGPGFTGNKTARITVTFTASVANPVLAWGGHISHRQDWGADNSAVAISGSPYHTRLIDLDGSGGNQDRSLSAEAVIYPASITAVKQATPESAQSFAFTTTGGLSPANFSLVDDGTPANTRAFADIIDFSTYTVAETTVPGWTLSFNDPVCTVTTVNGGSQSVSDATITIDLKEGENVTCTFLNSRDAGTLTVLKDVDTDGDGDVDATGATDWTWDISGGEQNIATGEGRILTTGDYTFSEDQKPNYHVTDLTCDGQSQGATEQGTVSVGLNGATCTFTNTRDTGNLVIIKQDENLQRQEGVEFEIDGQTYFTNVTGEISVSGIPTGNYSVEEIAGLAGYSFSEVSGANCTNSNPSTATVLDSETTTCTFTNTRDMGQITVVKHVVNDNGGNNVAADFTMHIMQGSDAVTPFAGSEAGIAYVLPTGTYTVSESGLPSGYTQTSIICDGQPTNTVTIGLNESKTCTITNNDDAPSVTLYKEVINNNGGTAGENDFGLTIGGTAVTSGQTLAVNANTPYALNEAGLAGYSFVSLTGDAACPQVLGGTVTLNEGEDVTCVMTNDDNAASLTVIKHVINDNGGTLTAGNFTMNVTGTNVSDASFAGEETPGTTVTLNAGGYSVDEDFVFGYAKSIGANCSGTIANGESKTCTITNDDVAPQLRLMKEVINDNGGTLGVSDFPLYISGTPVTSGAWNAVMANTQYTATEDGDAAYTASAWSGDCADNGTITLLPGEQKTCTITNNDIQPRLTVTKIVVNDDNGNAVVSDFPLFVNATPVTSSVQYGFNAGSYIVSETNQDGYTAQISGDCDATGNVTLAAGDVKECTITNNDIAPTITLVKSVINNNGGTAGANDFGLTIGGLGVDSGQTLVVDANTPYALNEAGLFGYSFVSLTGEGCPAELGGTVTLDEGEDITCTITNDDIQPRLIVYKLVNNENGGDAVPGDFTMNVSGTNVNPSTFPGSDTGTLVTLNAGAYEVTEDAVDGYTAVYGDDCDSTIAVGESKTCIVTNTAQAAYLIVTKHVVNDDGGSKVAGDFELTINGVTVPSGATFAGEEAPGTTRQVHPGDYWVTETKLDGYTASYSAGCTGSIALGETKFCTITNDDEPGELTVIKHVVNDDGGNAVAGDFWMNVTGTNVSDTAFPGDESGTTVTLNAGAYSVNEIGLPGYEKTLSANCSGTIANGESKTCTITNDDVAPTITLFKFVVNDDGGNAGVNDFGLSIGATSVDSGQILSVDANTPYALNEAGLSGYSFLSLGGDEDCPSELGGTVTLDEGEDIECVITNDDEAPTVTLIKEVINNNGGTAGENDFGLTIGGTAVDSDETLAVLANTPIALNEAGDPDYTFVSFSGDEGCPSELGGTVTLDEGEDITCTITNDDRVAEISVEKDGPASVQAGDEITYTIFWEVLEPGFAKNAVLTDALPDNVTYVSASCGTTTGTCTMNDSAPGVVTWTLGDRASYDSGTVTVTVRTNNPERDGTLVLNEVFFTTDDTDTSDDALTVVESDFAVDIEKTAPATVAAGAQMTYTLNWSVSGNSPIDSLMITDAVPANTTFVSASNSGTATAGIVTWDLGSANPGDSGSVTMTVAVTAPLANGTVITNTGILCGFAEGIIPEIVRDQFISEIVGIEHCDEDTVTTTVSSAPTLSVSKTDSPDPVAAGANLTYTISWSIGGNAIATNVTLTDTLDANTTFVSASDSGTYDATTHKVSWNLGNQAPGASGTRTIVVTVKSPLDNGTILNNTVVLDSTENEPVSDTEPTTVVSAPQLAIEKTVNQTAANPGNTISYTITVTNLAAANAVAENVVISDTLPAGFTVKATGLATYTLSLGDLAPGKSATTSFEVVVGTGVAAGTHVNTGAAKADNNGEVKDDAAITVVIPQVLGVDTRAELTIDKTVDNTSVNPRGLLLYTVTVKNVGDETALNVKVTDSLPQGFTFVADGSVTMTFELGDLEPNHSRTVTYQVRVAEDAKEGTYTNLAVASADNADKVADQVDVNVRPGRVLAATGAGALEYALGILGAILLALGIAGIARLTRKENEELQEKP